MRPDSETCGTRCGGSTVFSTVRKLVRENVGGSAARGFNFQVGIQVGPTFAVMLLLFAAVCSVSLVLAQFDGHPRRCDHSGHSPPCGACEGVGGIVTSDTADDITIVPCKIEASSENPVRPIWGDPCTELATPSGRSRTLRASRPSRAMIPPPRTATSRRKCSCGQT